MINRATVSMGIAAKAALLAFAQSYRRGESLDSIMGYIDHLTGVYNRKAFERDMRASGPGCAMVMVDIDNFKHVNDTKGHLYGDKVLKRLAAILRRAAGPQGRAYRIAGDEFVLIVPQADTESACCFIRREVKLDEEFTVSQGVVPVLDCSHPNEAMRLLDEALYRSKRNGKDAVTLAAPYCWCSDERLTVADSLCYSPQCAVAG